MATIAIDLASAMLCFSERCYPALVGNDTPTGVFPVWRASTREAGYGDDVIAFARTDDGGVYAIHRVWTLRAQPRLASAHAEDRQGITGGCVNIVACGPRRAGRRSQRRKPGLDHAGLSGNRLGIPHVAA